MDNINFLIIKGMHAHIENLDNKKYKNKLYHPEIIIAYILLSVYFHIYA